MDRTVAKLRSVLNDCRQQFCVSAEERQKNIHRENIQNTPENMRRIGRKPFKSLFLNLLIRRINYLLCLQQSRPVILDLLGVIGLWET